MTTTIAPVALIRRPPCDRPVLFALAPEVCDTCGNLISEHSTPVGADATLRAMWKIMIDHGGIFNQYDGTPDQHAGDIMRAHMANCAVDFRSTEQPTMDGLSRFTDTFNDNDPVTMLHGLLYCACGGYHHERVAIADMTLGQLIWQVTHLDDQPDQLVQPENAPMRTAGETS